MKKFLDWKILLLLIVLLAAFLRFYRLSSIPSSLYRDEVSIGYNAYSILTTGRDEHGKFLPLSLQAIGDQKLPIYIYSTIPFVKAFGLTDFAPRLPAAISGILIVLLTYSITEIFFRKKYLSLLTSFMMAISPWGVFSSRIAYEPTLSLFLILLATILFLKSRKYKSYIYFSFCLFGLSLLTYHGSQIFTPIFLLGLIILNKDVWKKNKKKFLIGALVFILISFIAFMATFSGDVKKISGIGIFSDKSIQYYKIDRMRNEHFSNSIIVKLLHNKLTAYPFVIGENYLKAFSPQFLFDKGDQNPWQNMEEMGYFYLMDAPFIFIGVLLMAKKREKFLNTILLWLFVSPIPGSITIDAPGASRTLTILVPLIMVSSYGFYSVLQYFLNYGKKALGLAVCIFLCFLYLVSFIFFIDFYFIQFPVNRAIFYGYGYKQEVMISSKSKASKVILSGLYDYTYPYFLYYLQYPAQKFRSEVRYAALTYDNFLPVKSFGKFNFVDSINWANVCKENNSLIFDNYPDFPKEIKPDGVIYLPDHSPRFGYVTINSSTCSNYENSLSNVSVVK